MLANFRTPCVAFLGLACAAISALPASAVPLLVIDARTGEVLIEQEATRRWHPASLTKLMTAYVALKAVRQGRLTLDTPIVVSARAARMPPSKMGFKPGQEVTLDNALKMLMVKSANDIAVTIAEGVSGSVEAFADEMNRTAAEVGMRESHFVNPNGLHDPNHVSSARDMAIIGRALYRDFPQNADLYGIGALQLGGRIIPTHNGIMGRYPGADGMKTGFVCASGFNVVASATRGNRKLIAVVLGYPNAKARTLKAAALFDEGFSLSGNGRDVNSLQATAGDAPNIRDEICGRNRRKEIAEEDFVVPVQGYSPPQSALAADDSPASFFANDGRSAAPATSTVTRAAAITAEAMAVRPFFQPVPIYVGRAPGWTGPVLAAHGAEPQRAKPAATVARAVNDAEPIAKPVKLDPKKAKVAEPKKPKVALREVEEKKAKGKPDPKAKRIAETKPQKQKKTRER